MLHKKREAVVIFSAEQVDTVLTLYSALTTVSVAALGDVRQFCSICDLGYSVSIMWSGICVPNFRLSVNLIHPNA